MDANKNIEESNEEQLKKASTDETFSQAEPPITHNTQPLTEQDMEVHHHSHESHGKKNWKSYFWEFLMLFLAVFCGFMAEYQLEHKIENQREKKYIVSLVKDLELDVESFNAAFTQRSNHIRFFDSLLYLLKHYDDSYVNDVYYYSRFAGRSVAFKYHDRTIQQLKGSGNLRLIKNSKVADSITIYDNEIIKSIEIQQSFENQIRFTAIAEYGDIFNAFEWNEMLDSNTNILRIQHNPTLFNRDQKKINSFCIKIITLKTAYRITNRQIVEGIKSANQLVALLKREYHLE